MTDWRGILILLAILGVCVGVFYVSESSRKEKCEAKGGEYHPQYKSSGLCLPKGSVIDLDD